MPESRDNMESFIGHPLGIGSYIARFLQFLSSIVVLGLTGWALKNSKTVTVIYSLIIVRMNEAEHESAEDLLT